MDLIREEIRPECVALAKRMESRLRENANRGEWRAYNFWYLGASLAASGGHLVRALQADKLDAIQKCAPHTGDYARMIADLYENLAMRRR